MINSFLYKRRGLLMALLALLPALASPSAFGSSASVADQPHQTRQIIVFGDSLTAGYGLPPEQAFPVQLQKAIQALGTDVKVINAGVSGDTTASALARLEWSLAGVESGLVIVELGGNDALRGLPPAATQDNLDRIITMIKAKGLTVLLTGMLAPPNMGDEYAAAFNAVFPAVAEKHQVAFDPFFLEGVAGVTALNQNDGIHPNAAGVEIIARRLAPVVIKALEGGAS